MSNVALRAMERFKILLTMVRKAGWSGKPGDPVLPSRQILMRTGPVFYSWVADFGEGSRFQSIGSSPWP